MPETGWTRDDGPSTRFVIDIRGAPRAFLACPQLGPKIWGSDGGSLSKFLLMLRLRVTWNNLKGLLENEYHTNSGELPLVCATNEMQM